MIDSHVHINHEDFINSVDDYITASKASGVNAFLCVGWDLNSSILAVKIANLYHNIWACVGVHPSDIKQMSKEDFQKIKSLLINKKVIAIGEIGLDFFLEKDKKEQDKQKEYFIKFIHLANEHNLPIVVHTRNAIDDTLQILKTNLVKNKGVIHCYTANIDYIKKFSALGFYFGIGGVVTFKNAKDVEKIVEAIPNDRLLLETDAPYLTPVPFRGQSNHSKYLPLILEKIALIKKMQNKQLIEMTSNNFKKLFHVK
jgi:TatD DNase family protein